MSRAKCRNCNFINFAADISCKRCGSDILQKTSAKNNRGLNFAGFRRILFFLILGAVCYFIYQTFVEQTNQLNQKVKNQSGARKEIPEHAKGYENLIKNELKKNPTPTPQ